jgi:hypothetical protein
MGCPRVEHALDMCVKQYGERNTILNPPCNDCRLKRAERAALLIDAASYFCWPLGAMRASFVDRSARWASDRLPVVADVAIG